jgi:SP family sugar porter-like MFS transporter
MEPEIQHQRNPKPADEDSYDFRFLYILGISIITALGGFLFGYDWVVIGGAKPFYEAYFGLTSSAMIGWAVSCALIGCMAGAALSGLVTDKVGRKKVLIFSGLLFSASAIGTALSADFTFFVWARILGGVGIGLASNVSPMYIAEIAPAKHRGRLVSINQLTIVLGILAAQIANWLIAEPVPADASSAFIMDSWNGQNGWRWMFGVEVIPAGLFFLLAWFVPESPRWLVKKNLNARARDVLQKIGGTDYADDQLSNVRESLEKDQNKKVSISELWKPALLPILAIGVGLAVFQQWSGINVIFNYADEIFSSAGYGVTDILFNIIITGAINLIFTLVAMQTVDKWGRKKLLLIGSGGLSITYLLLAYFYYTQTLGMHMLILVLIGIALYAVSLAPVTWVVISEIFPNRIRGAAMSVSVFALWFASLVLTYTFPILNEGLGEGAKGTAFTFCVYAGVCVIGFVLIYLHLPETKGKSLEELEEELVYKEEK